MGEITRILSALRAGQTASLQEELVALVYDDLRAMARSTLQRERPDHSLQATDLVHEAWLRTLRAAPAHWENRRHFYQAAAQAMRRILIDHARSRARVKRGGRRVRLDLTALDLGAPSHLEDAVALDDAFCRLEEEDRRAADVVRLRYYAGLSVEETAVALDISVRTVKREWAFGRAWLLDALGAEAGT